MKSKDFAALLSRLRKLTPEANSSFAELYDTLVPVFQVKPTARVLDVFEVIEKASAKSISLKAAANLAVEELTPKKPARKQKAAIRDDVAAAFVSELEAQLGKEQSAVVHAKLKVRGAVSEPEAKLISKQFYGEPGGTKAAALANIWRRHQSITDLKALGRASAGRSAA